jgi:hypothetical protein
MSRNDKLTIIKNETLAQSIKRKEKLAALNDYVGFVVTKLSGFAALITGILEMSNPDFNPITLMPPESVVAFGLAMLTGTRVINLLAKVANSLKQ